MTRDATKKILDMVAEGAVDKDVLIRDLLGWMSEDDVREFIDRNDYVSIHDQVEDEDECEFCGQDCDGECDEALAGGFQE